MSGFFNRLNIYGDIAHGTHVYLDGVEIKGCVEAKLELTVNAPPMLTVKVIVDNHDVDMLAEGKCESYSNGL